MTILLTGASGFVGLNVLTQLVRRRLSARIVAVDLEAPELFEQTLEAAELAGITYWQLDVQDRAACFELLREACPTHIVHAAAVTLPDEMPGAPELTAAVNVGGTENVFAAAVACGSVERCLLVSSSGVYDQSADGTFCSEDTPLDLRSVYARTKREAEMLMEGYESRGGFPIVAARVGPVYGRFERSRPTRPATSLIQQLTDALREGRRVRVAGAEVYRDWTYAGDVARALEALLFAPVLRDRVYNVSSGVSISSHEILALFAEHGLQIEWSEAETAEIVLDPAQSRKPLLLARLKRDTNFASAFDLRAGVASMLVPAHKVSTLTTERIRRG